MTYKTFSYGDVFTAADAQTLMDQGVIWVQNAAEREAIPAPREGMRVYRADIDLIEIHNGSMWLRTASRPVLAVQTSAVSQGWSTSLTTFKWGGAGAAYAFDTDGMFDPAQNDRLTAKHTGFYRISYSLLSTGIISANTFVDVNGSGVSAGISGASFGQSGAGTNPQGHGVLLLEAGDYIRVMHQSPSTGSGTWSGSSSQVSMQYLGQDLRSI